MLRKPRHFRRTRLAQPVGAGPTPGPCAETAHLPINPVGTGASAIIPTAMTLRRKMAIQIAAMIVGLLLVSAASLWGLNALYAGYGQAWKGYEQLRFVIEVRTHLQVANSLL